MLTAYIPADPAEWQTATLECAPGTALQQTPTQTQTQTQTRKLRVPSLLATAPLPHAKSVGKKGEEATAVKAEIDVSVDKNEYVKTDVMESGLRESQEVCILQKRIPADELKEGIPICLYR